MTARAFAAVAALAAAGSLPLKTVATVVYFPLQFGPQIMKPTR
jgi:hypothetical protein